MNWYGEIRMSNSSVDWGVVTPGAGFDTASAVKDLSNNISSMYYPTGYINYICNGDYSGGVKVPSSGQSWKKLGNQSQTVSLRNNHNNAADTFSLKVGRGTIAVPSTDATTIPDNATTIDMLTDGTITGMGGTYVTDYKLYLSVSSNLTYPGRYSGVITFVLANR